VENLYTLRDVSLELPIGKNYRKILQNINLDISAGKIYTIVGASGCGKTSLLRVLGGLTLASSGAISYLSNPVKAPPDGVAFVFQDYASVLLPWRNIAKNVSLGIESKLSKIECGKRVEDAIALVKLSGRELDYPWQLSGGMQQRVQLARALATKPTVLLMDEPFAALDAMTKTGLQDELLKLRDQTGVSIVFITHDIEEAIYLGDEVSLMQGPPGQIVERIQIDLPQNKNQVYTRSLPQFLEYRKYIYGAIEGCK
jgi:NitT/TauT family transport system ATP-binding protein